MPKVTVYVRNEDIAAWRSIGAKTTFVHNALKQIQQPGLEGLGLLVDDRVQVTTLEQPLKKAKTSLHPKIIKTNQDALKVIAEEVCTGHDHFRRDCGRKGCQYK